MFFYLFKNAENFLWWIGLGLGDRLYSLFSIKCIVYGMSP